jgi:hypothetical protein
MVLATAHQLIPRGVIRDDEARTQGCAVRTSGLDMTTPRGSVMKFEGNAAVRDRAVA